MEVGRTPPKLPSRTGFLAFPITVRSPNHLRKQGRYCYFLRGISHLQPLPPLLVSTYRARCGGCERSELFWVWTGSRSLTCPSLVTSGLPDSPGASLSPHCVSKQLPKAEVPGPTGGGHALFPPASPSDGNSPQQVPHELPVLQTRRPLLPPHHIQSVTSFTPELCKKDIRLCGSPARCPLEVPPALGGTRPAQPSPHSGARRLVSMSTFWTLNIPDRLRPLPPSLRGLCACTCPQQLYPNFRGSK